MIACVDVDYRSGGAVAAALWFEQWDSPAPVREHAAAIGTVADYVPGQFYRRELPCILEVLGPALDASVVIVDGYVWLDRAQTRPGLGAHLHRALHPETIVVGVAKNQYAGGTGAAELLRGRSTRPLYVTAEGMSLDEARACVASMHGAFRVPTLLRRVDRLARTWSG